MKRIARLSLILVAIAGVRAGGAWGDVVWEMSRTLGAGGAHPALRGAARRGEFVLESPDGRERLIGRLGPERYEFIDRRRGLCTVVPADAVAKVRARLRERREGQARSLLAELTPVQRKLAEGLSAWGTADGAKSAAPQIRKVDEVEKILGLDARRYEIRWDDRVRTLWTSDHFPELRDLVARVHPFRKLSLLALEVDGDPGIEGFPLKVESGSLKRAVTAIHEEEVGLDRFAWPPGCRRVEPEEFFSRSTPKLPALGSPTKAP